MNAKKTAFGRAIAGAGAIALALAGLLGGATVASAADLKPGPGQEGAPTAGSLTIHKRVGDQGEAGDGTKLENAPGEKLNDVEFTLWRLGTNAGGTCKPIDLATFDGWEHVSKEAAPSSETELKDKGFCVVGDPVKKVTAGEGEAEFKDLALGLYYVKETKAPANVTSPAAPFYVSVPLPYNTDTEGGWIYDVHVYPKNQELDKPVKTINSDDEQPDKGLTVGSVVEWKIEQVIPKLNDGDTFTSASVWDKLTDALSYDKTISVKAGDTELVVNEDYTVDASGVKWTLTENGLKKLVSGQKLTVVFTTKVVKVTETGDIDNPGSDDPDKPGYGSEFNGGTTPGGPTPHTYWGQLQVKKIDDSKPARPLVGAEFKVFNNYDGSTCPAEAPAEGAVATGTSDAQGIVQWENVDPTSPLGLWVANSEDGPLQNPSKFYCLYETKVPAGHSADQQGKPVEIKPGETQVNELDVVNPKKEGPNLPLTGAGGTLLLSVIGVGLAAAGVTLAVVSRRKRQA